MTFSRVEVDSEPSVQRQPSGLDGGFSSAQRAMLLQVCSWPELSLLAAEVRFSMASGMGLSFVSKGRTIVLGPEVLQGTRHAAVTLRHALELAQWQRICGEDYPVALGIAVGLLACRASSLFAQRLGLTLRNGRRTTQSADFDLVPEWLSQLHRVLSMPAVLGVQLQSMAMRHVGKLLQLQGLSPELSPGDVACYWPKIVEYYEQALPVAAPLELLLTTGGDSRLHVHSDTGLNSYGCSPRPRPWAITFASTTATSISSRAYALVHSSQQNFRHQALRAGLAHETATAADQVRTGIAEICGAEPDTEIVLTASGTDAEICALYLSLLASNDQLVNVVMGPNETGSNVMLAAAGCHYDSLSPLGSAVQKAKPLDPFFQDRVQALGIDLRLGNGQLRPADEVTAEIESTIARAMSEGKRVLLHVLDVSKTGLLAPHPAKVLELKLRCGDRLDVVVDACQLRLGEEVLRAYCDAGFLLLISGSKFFTGPPFAGALLVPRTIAKRVCNMNPLPMGLRLYTTRDQWPPRWGAIRNSVPGAPSIGLLLRWQAALCEARAFRAAGAPRALSILSSFTSRIRDAIESRTYLNLLSTRPIDRAPFGRGDGWDTLQTIFTFTISIGARVMNAAELARLYRWLNQDLSGGLPSTASALDRRVAAQPCHIGQPVVVARDTAGEVVGMRIAAGARLVSGICFDHALGDTPEQRLSQEVSDLLLVFAKLDIIVQNYAQLATGTLENLPEVAPIGQPAHDPSAIGSLGKSLDPHDRHELLADCL